MQRPPFQLIDYLGLLLAGGFFTTGAYLLVLVWTEPFAFRWQLFLGAAAVGLLATGGLTAISIVLEQREPDEEA